MIRQSTFETKTKQLGEYSINVFNLPQLSDANGKAKDALKQTQAQLQRTADELRKSHPEVEQQATALKDKLQSAVATTVEVIYFTFSWVAFFITVSYILVRRTDGSSQPARARAFVMS